LTCFLVKYPVNTNVLYSPSIVRSSIALGVGLLATALLPGCGRQDVSSYRIPKPDTTQATHSPADIHDQGMAGQVVVPGVKWKTPAGWEEVAPGQMRVASFRVKGGGDAVADVGVVPLPGMAGSDLDNVNRWRAQVGLAAVKQEELAGLAEDVEVAGSKGQLFDLAGQNAGPADKTRLLAVILRKDGIAWFFKMTGPDALVASQKGAFREFLQGVSFTGGTMAVMPLGHPPAGGMQLPPSHPPLDGMTNIEGLPPSHPPVEGMGATMGAGAVASGAGKPARPEWTVPAGWVEAAAGAFLVAKFQLRGEGAAEASVNVSTSTGAGGGVAGNVNRWRGQLGLDVLPDDKIELTKMQTTGGEASVVDLTGADARSGKKLRLVGVVLPQGDRAWFYKLMGDESVVAKEKEVFLDFVKGAKTK